jgi:hypothetical protein
MRYACTCGGRFKTYSVRTIGNHRLKYLRCDSCKGRTQVSVAIDHHGKEIPTIVLQPSTRFFLQGNTSGRMPTS